MGKESKQFDGYRYTLYRKSTKKSTATKVANGLRNKGKFSRITKVSGGYKVWSRPMPFAKRKRRK